MKEVILATLTGVVVGGIFSFFRMPIPAPPTLAGVMGIIGIFVGYVLVKLFLKYRCSLEMNRTEGTR